MTKKKFKEIKQLGKAELENKLKELKKEFMKSSTQKSIGTTPENPGRIKQIKKMIARILTLLNNKNLKEVKNQ